MSFSHPLKRKVQADVALEGHTDPLCQFQGNDAAVEYQDGILHHIVRPWAGAVVPGFLVGENICSSFGCVFLNGTLGICPDIVEITYTLLRSSFEEVQGFTLTLVTVILNSVLTTGMSGVLLLGWNKNLQPLSPLWNGLDIPELWPPQLAGST